MKSSSIKKALLAVAFAGASGVSFYAIDKYDIPLEPAAASYARVEPTEPTVPLRPRVEHLATPESVKAVYMSQCAASTQSFRDSLFKLADETEINAIVVDLKDYSGTISFPSDIAEKGGKGCAVPDFEAFVKEMHRRDIYVIGRMTVFQDPLYTKAHPEQAVQKKSGPPTATGAAQAGGIWHDYKGLAFVDVGATQFWGYIITLAKEAHALGVDEINFDYIRYPSDGPMSEAEYTLSSGSHAENMERFFFLACRKFIFF